MNKLFLVVRNLFATLFFVMICGNIYATHNRAGEITYQKIGFNLYKAKIVTYTKTSSSADRPSLEFWWGDGDRDTLNRDTIIFNVGPDIQRNEYTGIHTYPGNGTYTMYFLDENRNGAVVNIPGSINVPFYVETRLTISPFTFQNNSPQLLQPPIDDGAVSRLFIHNPDAYDPDGDSLSYELVYCKGAGGLPIPNYFYPAANNSFTLNPVTGDLVWDTPQGLGEYNVAMLIREWRKVPGFGSINIGYVTRDMQITIYPPQNDPPVIATLKDTCVEAGASLNLVISATDPNGELTTLTASGGPLTLSSSPATFTSTSSAGTVTGNFDWNTNCSHVRKTPYTVVFKAKDSNSNVSLADLEQIFITVVGPSPKNPTVVPQGNSLILNWNRSSCSEAIGYNIYRRVSAFGFTPGYCETGVPSYTGYALIGTVNGLLDTTFTDSNNGQGLSPAVNYCYMVTAFYPDGAESYASVEFCGLLKRDLPVITNVDVVTTSTSNGSIYVAWSKPTQLDFTQTPGPFRYVLQRAIGSGNFSDVISKTSLDDTIHVDLNLNTTDNQYRYRVQFWNDTPGNIFQIGTTQVASSIFLSVSPGDKKCRLSSSVNVPWANSQYIIYRQTNGGTFDSIDVTGSVNYIDDSLINGVQYCYYIKSIGAYGDTALVNPIVNRSEIKCSTPIDNEPPCKLLFSHVPYCEELTDSLFWKLPDSCTNDIASFQLYYASTGDIDFSLVATIQSNTNNYVYTNAVSISGCYYLTATDSIGNISQASNVLCVEGCPYYELPNVFTPDENGSNDLFHPFPKYRDVKDVDMKIFNRWGGLVFETTDPEIRWNGKKDNKGENLPESAYFYICVVNESYRDRIKPRVIRGYVQLFRGEKTK